MIESINEMRSCFKSKENIIKENPYELLSKKMDDYFEMMLKLGVSDKNQSQVEYEVSFEFIDVNGSKVREFIKINQTIRVCDVLDSVFCILNGQVEPYKYLETWIVREKGTQRYVVISDVQNLILAMDVFKVNTQWIVEFLDKPYVPNNIYNSTHNDIKWESFSMIKKRH